MLRTEPPPHSIVELFVEISASPAQVWLAIVEANPMIRWMGGFRWESSWEVGAPLAICGTLNRRPYREVGRVLAFEPGSLLSYEHWGPLWRVPNTPVNRAAFTLSLEPMDDGTRVTLRHELPEVRAIAEHSRFFWRAGLRLLKEGVERI